MKRFVLLAVALVTLAACDAPPRAGAAPPAAPSFAPPSGSPPPPFSESDGHNDTDVMFLQMMAAQYGPAAELLKLAAARSANTKVRDLAAAMDVTQADELTTVQGWLRAWA